MARKLENLRNIGIIAHIDAGKTTLTERMLFYAGATHRMGDVDKGTTETDFDAEEQQRGITIYSACVTFEWDKNHINLIDTPGHVDFTAEVERSLRVLDGGVVVFSAREGVEAQSETVWRQADRYHVPRIAFINKMDREGADFDRVIGQIRERLYANPVVVMIPVGSGPPHLPDAFRGIIDLIDRKLLTFDQQKQGSGVARGEIPDEMLEIVQERRDSMLEQLYDYSDELMELALEGSEVPPALLRRVLREATLHQMVVPVLCGSALDFVGVQPILDAVISYLPSPLDIPPVEGVNPKKRNASEKRKPDPGEPFCGLVFKIVADKHGDLSYIRVYSGTLKAGSRLLNSGRDKKENAAQLWHIQADHREQVTEVSAGDIVGIIGLRNSYTGDTLCVSQHPIVLESIEFPETVISMAIEPESSAERKKLAEVLEMMKRQDPTFRAAENEETGQTIISGMGELHLEIIKNKLLRDFNLDVKVHKPRVSYRESVGQKAEVVGECHRQIAGRQLFAKLRIRIEPYEGKSPVTVVSAGSSGERADELPFEFAQIAIGALRDQAEGGGSFSFPLLNVRLTVLGGEVHETESDELAFRFAAADAFTKALATAGSVLFEPVMKLEVSTPEEHLGEFVSDFQQRRAIITQTTSRGNVAILEAEAPLASLFGYSSAMRSLSQGRASCSMQPCGYAAAPAEVQKKFG